MSGDHASPVGCGANVSAGTTAGARWSRPIALCRGGARAGVLVQDDGLNKTTD